MKGNSFEPGLPRVVWFPMVSPNPINPRDSQRFPEHLAVKSAHHFQLVPMKHPTITRTVPAPPARDLDELLSGKLRSIVVASRNLMDTKKSPR